MGICLIIAAPAALVPLPQSMEARSRRRIRFAEIAFPVFLNTQRRKRLPAPREFLVQMPGVE
jgi:hypothetical protein